MPSSSGMTSCDVVCRGSGRRPWCRAGVETVSPTPAPATPPAPISVESRVVLVGVIRGCPALLRLGWYAVRVASARGGRRSRVVRGGRPGADAHTRRWFGRAGGARRDAPERETAPPGLGAQVGRSRTGLRGRPCGGRPVLGLTAPEVLGEPAREGPARGRSVRAGGRGGRRLPHEVRGGLAA